MRQQTTNSIAIRKATRNYRVNLQNGFIYNNEGLIIGSNTYEPRISVRVETPDGRKKYGVRISRVMAYAKFGPEALNPNVQVRHRDGNKFNNAGSNLILIRRHRGSLNASTIRRIRKMADRGLTNVEISGRTGTSRYQVSRVTSGEAYASVR